MSRTVNEILSSQEELDILRIRKMDQIARINGVLAINDQEYMVNFDDFEYLDLLNNATCGHVKKIRHRPTDVVMAVKQKQACNQCGMSQLEYEKLIINMPVDIRYNGCPHFVKCYGYLLEESLWIFMELMETSLDKLMIRSKHAIPEYVLGQVAVAVVEGMFYLEEKYGIAARCIRPCNVMFDEAKEVKLTDVRLCPRFHHKISNFVTLDIAPEIRGHQISLEYVKFAKENVFHFGLTLLGVAAREFAHRQNVRIYETLTAVNITLSGIKYTAKLKDFIKECVTYHPEMRPGFRALMKHPFFQKYKRFNKEAMTYLAINSFTKIYDNWSQALLRHRFGVNHFTLQYVYGGQPE